MNLLINYFTLPNLQRYSEFITCIHENLGNKFIKKIIVFISDNSEFHFHHKKLEVIYIKNIPTFKDRFEYCNKHLKDEICIISNTDIFFDETLEVLNKTIMTNVFVALSRHDIVKEGETFRLVPFHYPYSQDTWIFKAPVKISEDMNFPTFYHGCDNKIAKVMFDLGYSIRNPLYQIITGHFHLSQFRKRQQTVPPPYLGVEPTDDIDKVSGVIQVKGFDALGQPIL